MKDSIEESIEIQKNVRKEPKKSVSKDVFLRQGQNLILLLRQQNKQIMLCLWASKINIIIITGLRIYTHSKL